jgi:hypothetical protein
MFPEIPQNWKSLPTSDLRSLAASIRTAVQAALADEPDADTLSLAEQAVTARKEILAFAKARDAADAAAAEMSEDDEAEPVAEEVDEDEAVEAEAADESEPAAADDTETEAAEATTEDTPQEVEASVKPQKVRTGIGASAPAVPEATSGFTPDKLLARDGIGGKTPGTGFGTWLELAEALVDVGSSISPTSSQKFQVAYVPGNFDDFHTLSDSMTSNLRKFEPEILAEMCAPAQPQYDLACWNTDRRPVRNALSGFKPDARGAVTIYPSPSLADITGQAPAGTGIWTNDDDISLSGTNPSSKECAVIECAEPTLYRLYGVWRCLTVQNLLAITFPELVEAYLNRLAAAHARLAETQLLEAMGTAATPVSSANLGYGSSVSIGSSILGLLALHQERERWDSEAMQVWLPRWVMYAMKTDMMRRRNTSGVVSVPSDSQIEGMFRDVGVDPVWFIDTPSWAPAIPAVHTGGTLNLLPDEVTMVIAPRGKFAVMDRGELSIGVTGNNIYRDNASNAKNQFTFFFENFEALVNTDSCPAYLLTVEDLCHNGVQIDDAVLDCAGAPAGS